MTGSPTGTADVRQSTRDDALLAVDRAGLGPGGRHLLTPPRVAGAALCLVAVGIGVLGEGAREADPLLLLAVVAAGFLIAVQWLW